ncbi:MAG: S1 RNA-binding domain-containing protein, partial [Anaerolineales bacterium]|nr:S1 RNA-binding domain-containing protein [Anaerolineales bacterium]
MENENLENQGEDQSREEGSSVEQPGWFKDFVDHYDVDKPQQGEILKGTILDIQDSSILLDVGFKRDAIIPGQDLEKVDQELRQGLAVGDEIFVSVLRTPVGDDDLLVSLHKALAQKTWVKAEELAKSEELVELEVVDQNRGGLLVAYENLRGFVPNSHIPSIRRGMSTQKTGEIKAELMGKLLPVKAIEVDQKESRLLFSARVAQKDQRQKRLKEIEVGTVIKSRVVNVVDFGIFVDLEGVDGLVHKSEIDWARVNKPSKLFKAGDEIEVKVVGVDLEKERVSLSRKVLLPNPWHELVEKFNEGDLVDGKVISVLDFGAFVELKEGLQGLVHVSEVGYENTEDPKSAVRKGDQVLVKIMGIDPRRERVSLSMRRVPVSEQMDWMMNLEDAQEGLLVDGGEADPPAEIVEEAEEVQADVDQKPD